MSAKHHQDDAILREFGDALRRERHERGMTQEAAAAEVDIDRAGWSFMENARRNVSLVTAARAAKALGLSLGELLSEPKRRSRKSR
jgi:transcriptional regulator with XRE-family HTH domain